MEYCGRELSGRLLSPNDEMLSLRAQNDQRGAHTRLLPVAVVWAEACRN